MEFCFGDYSDYENAPGGLATFGGFFFCDFQATLAANIDYGRGKIPPQSRHAAVSGIFEKSATYCLETEHGTYD